MPNGVESGDDEVAVNGHAFAPGPLPATTRTTISNSRVGLARLLPPVNGVNGRGSAVELAGESTEVNIGNVAVSWYYAWVTLASDVDRSSVRLRHFCGRQSRSNPN